MANEILAAKFPNGVTSYLETHFEIVSHIERNWESNKHLLVIQQQQGHGGFYELAEEITDAFELKNKGREWDGEFFDEIEEFFFEYIVTGI
jgi:hypothetical protein